MPELMLCLALGYAGAVLLVGAIIWIAVEARRRAE
jgi:hypothetical protein